MPTLHRTVDTEVFPVRTGSISAERVAVDRRRDSAKAQSGFAVSYSRGRKVPIYSAPCPRKESKTIGFGGVLWALSVAADRKCPAGGIYGHKGCRGRPFRRFALPPLMQGRLWETDHHHVFAINTVCNYDKDIIPYLRSEFGSAYIRINAAEFARDDGSAAIFIAKQDR